MPRSEALIASTSTWRGRERSGWSRRIDPLLTTTASVVGPPSEVRSTGAPRSRLGAERALLPRALRGRDERELEAVGVVVARHRVAGQVHGRVSGAERHEGYRELVHAVSADERCHLGVGEGGEEARRQACRVGEGERLGQHGAGVPVDVAEAALAVAPAGAPRHPRDDDGHGVTRRRRAEHDESMGLRVVPVQSRLQPVDRGPARDGDVEPRAGSGPPRSPRRGRA